MTDKEIKQALDERTHSGKWIGKGFLDKKDFLLLTNALDLINRQQEKIERLEKELSTATNHITRLENQIERLLPMLNIKRAEVIKEFAERLKEKVPLKTNYHDFVKELIKIIHTNIDNLVKEMVGEQG